MSENLTPCVTARPPSARISKNVTSYMTQEVGNIQVTFRPGRHQYFLASRRRLNKAGFRRDIRQYVREILNHSARVPMDELWRRVVDPNEKNKQDAIMKEQQGESDEKSGKNTIYFDGFGQESIYLASKNWNEDRELIHALSEPLLPPQPPKGSKLPHRYKIDTITPYYATSRFARSDRACYKQLAQYHLGQQQVRRSQLAIEQGQQIEDGLRKSASLSRKLASSSSFSLFGPALSPDDGIRNCSDLIRQDNYDQLLAPQMEPLPMSILPPPLTSTPVKYIWPISTSRSPQRHHLPVRPASGNPCFRMRRVDLKHPAQSTRDNSSSTLRPGNSRNLLYTNRFKSQTFLISSTNSSTKQFNITRPHPPSLRAMWHNASPHARSYPPEGEPPYPINYNQYLVAHPRIRPRHRMSIFHEKLSRAARRARASNKREPIKISLVETVNRSTIPIFPPAGPCIPGVVYPVSSVDSLPKSHLDMDVEKGNSTATPTVKESERQETDSFDGIRLVLNQKDHEESIYPILYRIGDSNRKQIFARVEGLMNQAASPTDEEEMVATKSSRSSALDTNINVEVSPEFVETELSPNTFSSIHSINNKGRVEDGLEDNIIRIHNAENTVKTSREDLNLIEGKACKTDPYHVPIFQKHQPDLMRGWGKISTYVTDEIQRQKAAKFGSISVKDLIEQTCDFSPETYYVHPTKTRKASQLIQRKQTRRKISSLEFTRDRSDNKQGQISKKKIVHSSPSSPHSPYFRASTHVLQDEARRTPTLYDTLKRMIDTHVDNPDYCAGPTEWAAYRRIYKDRQLAENSSKKENIVKTRQHANRRSIYSRQSIIKQPKQFSKTRSSRVQSAFMHSSNKLKDCQAHSGLVSVQGCDSSNFNLNANQANLSPTNTPRSTQSVNETNCIRNRSGFYPSSPTHRRQSDSPRRRFLKHGRKRSSTKHKKKRSASVTVFHKRER